MAVYQNKNKMTKDGRSWFFRTYYKDLSGTRKQFQSPMFFTKKEAKEQERIFLLNSTNEINIKDLTFKDLINDYLATQKAKVKVTTYNNYNKYLKKLEELYNIKLSDFNIVHFNQWKNNISKQKWTTVYKNNVYKFLLSLLHYASVYYSYDLSKIKNKMSGFTNPNELKKEMLFYTYDEFKKFIVEEKELKYKCYFEMLYYCGLRKGEANALTWNDINIDEGIIKISKNLSQKIKGQKYVILPPKTKSSIRTLPLPELLKNDLKELKYEYNQYSNFEETWFVFGGPVPLSDTYIATKNNNNAKKAKIKEIRIHDFRHSCASLLINNGASVSLVARYLGHSNISTTLNTYTHMFKNELSDIVNLINNLKK